MSLNKIIFELGAGNFEVFSFDTVLVRLVGWLLCEGVFLWAFFVCIGGMDSTVHSKKKKGVGGERLFRPSSLY